MNPHDPETFHKLFEIVHGFFPDAEDVFSERGVTRESLFLTMKYISLVTHHDIKEHHVNSSSTIFHCALSPVPEGTTRELIRKRKCSPDCSSQPEDPETAETGGNVVTETSAQHERNAERHGCSFCFFFGKRITELWVLKKDPRNSIGKECVMSSSPSLCMHESFITTLIRRHLFRFFISGGGKKEVEGVSEALDKVFSFSPSKSTLKNAWKCVKEADLKSILEQTQKVESYLMILNKNGHYGVILYSNGDFVVPSPDCQSSQLRSLDTLRMKWILYSIRFKRKRPFWEKLPTKEPSPEKEKSISMTFQAVSAAVRAFQYSLPVICLDACRMCSYHTDGVILSATFATTDLKLMTMCIGTAESESGSSWTFFLTNLRQALIKFCPELQWNRIVFMSDRHKGLIKGVEKIFPSNHHLFCVWHLLNNCKCSGNAQSFFWKAVEAENRLEFNTYFQMFVDKVPRAERLRELESKWSRFAISKKCRRYCVRTNNWSESQNNAMRFLRDGSIFTILLKSFEKIVSKLVEFHKYGEKHYSETSGSGFDGFTSHVNDVLEKNRRYVLEHSFSFLFVGMNSWIVREGMGEKWHSVTLQNGKATCSCLRYFDEGIPCPHILFVLYKTRTIDQQQPSQFIGSFIDPIYRTSLFLKAFPSDMTVDPGDLSACVPNESVILPVKERKRGHPQVVRFPSVGEDLSKHPHVSLVFRKKRNSSSTAEQEDGESRKEGDREDEEEEKECEDWRNCQLLLATGDKYPEVIFPPLNGDPSPDKSNESETSDSSSEDETDADIERLLADIRFPTDESDDDDDDDDSEVAHQESSDSFPSETDERARRRLSSPPTRQERSFELGLIGTDIVYPVFHDVVELHEHRTVQSPPKKRSKTGDSEDEESTDMETDEETVESLSDRLSFILSSDKPDYKSWDGLYTVFEANKTIHCFWSGMSFQHQNNLL